MQGKQSVLNPGLTQKLPDRGGHFINTSSPSGNIECLKTLNHNHHLGIDVEVELAVDVNVDVDVDLNSRLQIIMSQKDT